MIFPFELSENNTTCLWVVNLPGTFLKCSGHLESPWATFTCTKVILKVPLGNIYKATKDVLEILLGLANHTTNFLAHLSITHRVAVDGKILKDLCKLVQ